MSMIHAAVVEAFDEPPRFRSVPEPIAQPGQEVVQVLAVGVSHAARGVASGKHYTSPAKPPFLAGIDAVVRRQDGRLAFIMAPGTGTLAERIIVDPADLIPVPIDADPAVVAATMNPALSPWVALKGRVQFEAGQSVLIIGATGNAGGMAVKVARHLGASRVIAAGRNRARLVELLSEGADEIVAIGSDNAMTEAAYAAAAAEVDAVLDYVWGPPTELAMRAILGSRIQHDRILDWVQVGGMGGTEITLGGHALRHNALRISGSGFGSVPMEVAQLAELAAAIGSGALSVRPCPFSLSDVEAAWGHEEAEGERTTIIL